MRIWPFYVSFNFAVRECAFELTFETAFVSVLGELDGEVRRSKFRQHGYKRGGRTIGTLNDFVSTVIRDYQVSRRSGGGVEGLLLKLSGEGAHGSYTLFSYVTLKCPQSLVGI